MLSVHCEGFFRNLLKEHPDWHQVATEKIYHKHNFVPQHLVMWVFYVSNNHKDPKSVTMITMSETGLGVSGVGNQVMNHQEIKALTERYKTHYVSDH